MWNIFRHIAAAMLAAAAFFLAAQGLGVDPASQAGVVVLTSVVVVGLSVAIFCLTRGLISSVQFLAVTTMALPLALFTLVSACTAPVNLVDAIVGIVMVVMAIVVLPAAYDAITSITGDEHVARLRVWGMYGTGVVCLLAALLFLPGFLWRSLGAAAAGIGGVTAIAFPRFLGWLVLCAFPAEAALAVWVFVPPENLWRQLLSGWPGIMACIVVQVIWLGSVALYAGLCLQEREPDDGPEAA